MFTQIHILMQANKADRKKYKDRWATAEGSEAQDKIIEILRKGMSEILLEPDFQKGISELLEGPGDLRGISFNDVEINFPQNGTIEGINFSHALLRNCKFTNVSFINVVFDFTDFYGCEFNNCEFKYTAFYASTIEKCVFVKNDFVINNSIVNSRLNDTQFEGLFIPANIFFDCIFNETVSVTVPTDRAFKETNSEILLDKTALGEIYKALKEGYTAGDVIKKSREYFFKEKQSIARYNFKNPLGKAIEFLIEIIAGYGVRPGRVFMTTITIFACYSAVFVHHFGWRQGMLISAGAFCTFGASSSCISNAPSWLETVYILESFSGISLMALFMTVLVNLWFRER